MKIKLFIILSALFLSCSSDDDKPRSKTATLYATYHYPSGSQPSLTPDLDETNKIIKVGNDPIVVTDEPGIIKLRWTAVRFFSSKSVYKVNNDEIITEHRENGKWHEDDENKLSSNLTKSLDIVLVLDVSSSLNENISAIKEDAVTMITSVLNGNPDIRIAVIKFSRGSVTSEFSSDRTYLVNFINTQSEYTSSDQGTYILENKDATALYESVDKAIDLLSSSTSVGKGILTFTDGLNNYWINPTFQHPNSIINDLTNSQIASYTIGFIGNENTVNKDVLEDIAVNGAYSFPKNTKDLDKVFKRFANNIAAVYDLTYRTENPSNYEDPVDYRFIFKLKKTN